MLFLLANVKYSYSQHLYHMVFFMASPTKEKPKGAERPVFQAAKVSHRLMSRTKRQMGDNAQQQANIFCSQKDDNVKTYW